MANPPSNAVSNGLGAYMTPGTSWLLDQHGLPMTNSNDVSKQQFVAPPVNNAWHNWQVEWAPYYTNPDAIPLSTYEEMTYDDTAFSAMEFMVLAILSRIKEYSHPDEKIQKRIREDIANMRYKLPAAAASVLTGLWAGFSVSEVVGKWSKDGGHVAFDYVQGIHPRSVLFRLDTDDASDDKSDVADIWQWWGTQWQRRLPRGKVILYSHRMRFGNLYGQSMYKAAYTPYYIRKTLWPILGASMARFASPSTLVGVSNPTGNISYNGQTMSRVAFALKLLEQMKASGVLAYGKDEMEAKLFEASTSMGEQFVRVFEHLEKLIMRGVLMPSLMQDHGAHGSSGQRDSQWDTFSLNMDQKLNDTVDCLIEQMIKPNILLNEGEQDDGYGDFATDEVKMGELKLFMDIVHEAAEDGFISSGRQQDMNMVRDRIGFDILDDDELLPPPTTTDGAPLAPAVPGMPGDKPDSEQQFSRTGRSRTPKSRNPKLRDIIRGQFRG